MKLRYWIIIIVLLIIFVSAEIYFHNKEMKPIIDCLEPYALDFCSSEGSNFINNQIHREGTDYYFYCRVEKEATRKSPSEYEAIKVYFLVEEIKECI